MASKEEGSPTPPEQKEEAKEEAKAEEKVEEKAETKEEAKEDAKPAAKKEEPASSTAPLEPKADEAPAPAPPTEESGDTTQERGRRVYVGNLAWQVSWQDLKDHMRSTGLEVVRANVMSTPDGRSRGCGIVEFATAEDAKQAVLTLNDTELRGRQIFVREDREDSNVFSGAGANRFSTTEQAQSRRVYVGNLSWDVAWQDLKDHMKQAGEVVFCEVMTDVHSGRSKGCGVVEFATEEEAQAAIETLSNTELRGRTIFVREDRESTSKTVGSASLGRSQNPSVYVWNLSPEISWQDLKDHMRKAGNVDSASVFVSSSGESSSGIVVYQRPQDAARAIRELQGTELHGMPMSLREDRMHTARGGRGGGGRGGRGGGRGFGRGGGGGGEKTETGTQVYVGNLSFSTTWRELKDHFRQCGEIKRAEVKMSQGQSKGFGTVQFFKKEDADAAVTRLNGSELQGRELEVRLDQKNR